VYVHACVKYSANASPLCIQVYCIRFYFFLLLSIIACEHFVPCQVLTPLFSMNRSGFSLLPFQLLIAFQQQNNCHFFVLCVLGWCAHHCPPLEIRNKRLPSSASRMERATEWLKVAFLYCEVSVPFHTLIEKVNRKKTMRAKKKKGQGARGINENVFVSLPL
jgi:hypothetical protein